MTISKEHLDKSRDTVIKLSRLGCSDKEIGSIVGFCDKSLERHMRKELDEGRGHLRASLRKAQIELAIRDKNPAMLIWLGKCYLRQRDSKQEVEHSGGINVEKVMFEKSKEITIEKK